MATRILVVDDSPTIRTVVSMILERNGYDPKVAFDGQDAYEALASGEVKADLVLVDFVMPRMNGYQFCRALRENSELMTIPVVLMSAKGDRIRDQFVQQTGAIDAITKPFDAQALVAVIENALRKVNTNTRASSSRLSDLEIDAVKDAAATSAPSIEYETQRTHIVQIVAQKLAGIVARTIAQRPEIVSSDMRDPRTVAGLTNAIAESLSSEALVEMMEVMGELRRDQGGALLSGDLAVVPVGAILQLLQAESQTGVLVCTSGSAEVRATFRAGAIDLVQSTGAGDEFRLGRFFIEEGVVTPSEIDEITRKALVLGGRGDDLGSTSEWLNPAGNREPLRVDEVPHSSVHPAGRALVLESPDTPSWEERSSAPPSPRDDPHAVTTPGRDITEVLAAVTKKPRPLGMVLLAAGKIVDSQLRAALTKQSSELLYEVLRWTSGRFELRREPPSELAENAKLGLPVASVVMEGFRRVDEWRVLERTLGSFDAVLLRDDTAFGKLDIASLPAKERAVLDAVDGERTVRAIVSASHLSSFDVCRILVQFLEARALRRRVA